MEPRACFHCEITQRINARSRAPLAQQPGSSMQMEFLIKEAPPNAWKHVQALPKRSQRTFLYSIKHNKFATNVFFPLFFYIGTIWLLLFGCVHTAGASGTSVEGEQYKREGKKRGETERWRTSGGMKMAELLSELARRQINPTDPGGWMMEDSAILF